MEFSIEAHKFICGFIKANYMNRFNGLFCLFPDSHRDNLDLNILNFWFNPSIDGLSCNRFLECINSVDAKTTRLSRWLAIGGRFTPNCKDGKIPSNKRGVRQLAEGCVKNLMEIVELYLSSSNYFHRCSACSQTS